MAVTLRRLECFVAVAEELHFGRAAERLHLTQPALSRHVHELERELGVMLLHRTSRRVELTDAGREVLSEARVALAAADAVRAAADRHRPAEAEPLAVGFTGSAASRMLPGILQRLRRRQPGITLSLRELTSVRYDELRDGTLDVVLGRLRPEEMPDLDVLVLDEEPRMAALWDGHPLAHRDAIALRELASDEFITQPEALNPAYRRAFLAEQRAHGLSGRVAAEASSIQEFLNLVATGRGVCLVPAAAAEFNRWPGVVYVDVPDAAGLPTSVVSRPQDPDERVVAFRRAAAARAKRGSAPAAPSRSG